MKFALLLLLLVITGCKCTKDCNPPYTVTAILSLSRDLCTYTLTTSDECHYWIKDSCGKYKVGDIVKFQVEKVIP